MTVLMLYIHVNVNFWLIGVETEFIVNSQGLIVMYKQTIKLFICLNLEAIVDTQAQ